MIVKNPNYNGPEKFDCSKFYYYRPSGGEGWGFYPCENRKSFFTREETCDVTNKGIFNYFVLK